MSWLIWKVPPALYDHVPDPEDRASAESATRTGLVAGPAGLAALGSLAVTARTYRLTQQGQITDRYTKPVAQLGDDKLEIRLGGVYALEPRDRPAQCAGRTPLSSFGVAGRVPEAVFVPPAMSTACTVLVAGSLT